MKRVLLIDLSSIYWANWHATADQSVSEAFERTIARVTSLRDGYDLVAICCDSPPYWRRDVLPEYKAQREAAPPQAVEQFTRVKERLRADGLLLWSAKGFEADDVIAFATEAARKDGHAVTIASSDKDLHQLVTEHVTAMSIATGVRFTPVEVFNKHGVSPDKMRDFLSLCGDASDNVPGVPKVGPKTAAALLNEFGTLDAVLAEAKKPPAQSDADENGSRITKPALKAALVEHEAAALLARRVITLRTDVPIDWKEIYMERTVQPLNEVTDAEFDSDPAPVAPKPASSPAATETPLPISTSKPTEAKPIVTAAPKETTALAIAAPEEWSLALEPRSSGGAWKVAMTLHDSRLYQNFGSPAAIFAVLMRGRTLGLDATTALAAFHNIKGKIVMHADLIEALVLRSGKAQYFEMKESTARKAVYVTKRVGSTREQELEFTIEDAFYAGLVKKDPNGRDGFLGISESGNPSNWDKYRPVQLRHRCKTQLARAVYADVVLGLYTPDEVGVEVIDTEGVAA